MKKSNSALALLMSAVMTVTLLTPDMFGSNSASADSADAATTDSTAVVSTSDSTASKEITVDSSKLSDLAALKEAVLEGLAEKTNYADYEFYYEYSFDSLSPSSVYTPSFLVDDQAVEDFFGDTSSISSNIIRITDEAYAALRNKLVTYAETSGVFTATLIEEGKKYAQEEFDRQLKEQIDEADAEYQKLLDEKLAEADAEYAQLKEKKIAEAQAEYEKTLAQKIQELEDKAQEELGDKYDEALIADQKAALEAEAKKTYQEALDDMLAEADKEYADKRAEKIAEADEAYAEEKQKAIDEAQAELDAILADDNAILELAAENGITVSSVLDEAFPEGKEGKAKLVSILSESYLTPFAGYDDIAKDGDTSKVSSDCVAYIPVTVKGKEVSIFGITLPRINVGTWNVVVESKTDSSEVYTGTVTIGKKTVSISQSDAVSSTGVVEKTGKGIDAFTVSDENCNTIEVYVGLENCDNPSIKSNGSNADKVFVSIIIPDTLPSVQVYTGKSAETVFSTSETIKTYLADKSVEDVCELINNYYAGAGDAIASFVNSYSNGLADVELKINELPSETGLYYAAAFAVDTNYNKDYETALFYINGEGVDDYALAFNEAVSVVDGIDTMYTDQDLGTTLNDTNGIDSGVKVYNIYVGKDLEGQGNGLNFIISRLELLKNKLSDSDKIAQIEKVEAVLQSGSLPGEKTAAAMTKLYGLYDIASDDDVLIAFLAEIAEEVIDNDFDLSDYGVYTNQDQIKEIGLGKYLQISVYATGNSYIALPIYRVFNLEKAEEAPVLAAPSVLNISTLNKSTENIVYWTTVDNAEGYLVYRRTSDGKYKKIATVEGGDTASYTDSTAEAGVKYFYTVKAYAGDTISDYNPARATIATPTVNVSAVSATSNKVTWTESSVATEYKVYRKTADGKYKSIATVKGTSYTDKTAKAGTTYYYTVRAIRENEGTYGYSWYKGVKTLTTPTVNVSAAASNKNKVTWNKITGATSYKVYRKTADGNYKSIATVKGTSYTDKTAKAGTTYYYTVRAIRTNKASESYSWYKGVKTLTTPTVNVSAAASNKNKVTWNKITGATSYKVYRKTADGKYKSIATVKGTSYTDKTAKAGTTYYYTVRAIRKNSTSTAYSWYKSVKILTKKK